MTEPIEVTSTRTPIATKANGTHDPMAGEDHFADLADADRSAPETEPPRITVVTTTLTARDLARPLPPLDYIVSALAMPSGPGAPHCFGGYGFSGKTVAAQALLLALAAQRAVWRAYGGPKRSLKCTHLDNEQGLALTQRRYQRGANAAGLDLEQLADNLRLLVFPKLSNGQRLYLGPTENRSAWADVMAERDLCLIDSLSATRSGGISENDSEVRRGIDMLGELSEETKCRPLIIHHANKGSDEKPGQERDARFSLRGSGGIFDACDSVYLLSGAKGEAVRVEQIKARSHGEPIDDFALVIEDVERDDDSRWGLSVHVAGVELIEEQRDAKAETKQAAQLVRDIARVRKALEGGKRLSRTDLVNVTRLSSGNFGRAWAAIVEQGAGGNDFAKAGRVTTNFHFLKGS